jgi:hypothetical protein
LRLELAEEIRDAGWDPRFELSLHIVTLGDGRLQSSLAGGCGDLVQVVPSGDLLLPRCVVTMLLEGGCVFLRALEERSFERTMRAVGND